MSAMQPAMRLQAFHVQRPPIRSIPSCPGLHNLPIVRGRLARAPVIQCCNPNSKQSGQLRTFRPCSAGTRRSVQYRHRELIRAPQALILCQQPAGPPQAGFLSPAQRPTGVQDTGVQRGSAPSSGRPAVQAGG